MGRAAAQADSRTPVTVITGYLGAGKTTLLNHLLSQSEQRLAVIVNEFGDVGVDGALVASGAEELVELANGCLCCVVRGDLIRTLRILAPRLSDFDGVVIETSGLANPSPVLQTLHADQVIGALYRLNGVVTVVDALHLKSAIASDPIAVEQIAMADLVVLNKSSSAPNLGDAVARIAAINRAAATHETDYGQVPPVFLTHLEPARVETYRATIAGPTIDHVAAGGITSLSVTCDAPLDASRLSQWMTEYLGIHGGDVIRSKGLVRVIYDGRPLLVQSVNTIVTGEFLEEWPTGAEPKTAIVFIGRRLDRGALEKGILGCVAVEKV